MTTYDRILTTEGRRYILRDLTETVAADGMRLFRGWASNPDGSLTETRVEGGWATNLVVLGEPDIKRRHPLRMNLKYDELEPTTDDNRMPYYPGREEAK